jgi:vacuolar-type H+-ATPase subunit F/Vma7
MSDCAFLGDEVTGLGFRLAGVEVYNPAPHEVRALVLALRNTTPLIILTAEVAAAVPPDLLRQTEVERWPLLLVIPDIRQRAPTLDLVADVRRQLGMAE